MYDALFVETRSLKIGLSRLARRNETLMHKACGEAAQNWVRDTSMVIPTTPLRTGYLRGSISAFVNHRLVTTSRKVLGKPATTDNAGGVVDKDHWLITVGANTPYARKHHEVPANFRQPGSGNQYIRAKLALRGKTYMEIIARRLRAGR